MEDPDLISLFVMPLERAGIRYMISGSVASALYGEPRATFDVDLAVHLTPAAIAKLATIFPESDFYLPPADVVTLEAGREIEGHFNIIHHASGLKADVYPSRVHPYHDWAWSQRRVIDTPCGPAAFCPPEYVILRKLEFLRQGGSDKHLRDIAGILIQQSGQLDLTLLSQAISRLRLEPEWQQARATASPE